VLAPLDAETRGFALLAVRAVVIPLLVKLAGLALLAVLAVVGLLAVVRVPLAIVLGRVEVALLPIPPLGVFLRNGLTLLFASLILIAGVCGFGTVLP
jgi:hypothetical protein